MAQLGVGRVMRLLSSLFLGRKTAAGGCVSGEDFLLEFERQPYSRTRRG